MMKRKMKSKASINKEKKEEKEEKEEQEETQSEANILKHLDDNTSVAPLTTYAHTATPPSTVNTGKSLPITSYCEVNNALPKKVFTILVGRFRT